MREAFSPPRLRQQLWAEHAYESVARIAEPDRGDYEIAVNNLGPNVLRNGLVAAMAELQRRSERGGTLLLNHLAGVKFTGLEDTATGEDLPGRVRKLEVDGYMVATREILQYAAWLRRATQATFGGNR